MDVTQPLPRLAEIAGASPNMRVGVRAFRQGARCSTRLEAGGVSLCREQRGLVVHADRV
jgi:hypothetical protein